MDVNIMIEEEIVGLRSVSFLSLDNFIDYLMIF